MKTSFIKIILLFILFIPLVVSAQKKMETSPTLLTPDKAYRYIKHLRTLPFIAKKTFGWMYYEKGKIPSELVDATSFQIYQFPNQITMIGISYYEFSGMVIYRTDTDSILDVQNWGNKIMESFPNDFDEKYGFTTYYKFYEKNNHWKADVFLFASLESGYRTMNAEYDYVDLRSDGSSMDGVTRNYRK